MFETNEAGQEKAPTDVYIVNLFVEHEILLEFCMIVNILITGN